MGATRYRSLQLCSSQDLAGRQRDQPEVVSPYSPLAAAWRTARVTVKMTAVSHNKHMKTGWMKLCFSQVITSELMFRVTHPGFSQKPSHSSNNQNRKEKRKKTEKNGHFISSLCVTSQRRSQTAAQTENLSAVTSFQGEPRFTVCSRSVPVGCCSLGSYKIIYQWG